MTRVLLINQSFYPDLAASGQYLTDLAFSLQEQGAQVRVLTSKHAYIEQEVNSFSSFEEYRGITIRRIAVPGARWRQRYLRMLSSILLNIFLMLVYLLLPRNEKVVVLTSPPLLFWFIAFANMFRHHAELYFWSMDLNPQQAIETGWVKKESFLAHTLLCFNRFFLKKAKKIFALDEAMRERLLENGVPDDRIVLSPLWTDLARLA
ncbi:MAG: glycosyltransferase, partial [Bdellovibrionales bacterium]|nr:glycosyltransferase [Bdellovibrionales bacterium]